MSDSDSMTRRIMERICDRRAGYGTKVVMRSLVRAAIDRAWSEVDGTDAEIEQIEQIAEEFIDDTIACVMATRRVRAE